MSDMLVKLYELPDDSGLIARLEGEGIRIRRAMTPDKFRVVPWVQEHAGLSAAGEGDVSFSNKPASCFIATLDADIIGYACYDATCINFFGPTLVKDAYQGKGIGKALLIRSLRGMLDKGYAYAIIGGVGPASFYKHCVGAMPIPGSTPGIYADYLGRRG
ncbi:MAG: GNAT family N-acetyltransferase [Eubacteriales bacterium]|nr:GNAT family N-acetyltransferase [Eubacteriales bacterium]